MYIRNDKDVKKESKMNKVLIYLGTSNLKEKVIEDVFKQIGIEINYIDDDDLENTLERLLELPRKEGEKGKREPFMFIDGDNVDEIKNLESILRDNNVKIERKAVKTKNNISWTLRALMDEVDEEFEYFQLRDHLYNLIMHPDKEKLKKDPDYLKLMSMAFSLLEGQNVGKDILEIAIKSIENFKN